MYGPQTTLYLHRTGNMIYRWILRAGFILVESGLKFRRDIGVRYNASNTRHWLAPVQRYLSDMLLGRWAERREILICAGPHHWSPMPLVFSTVVGFFFIPAIVDQNMRTDVCGLFMRLIRYLLVEQQAALRLTCDRILRRPKTFTSGLPWFLVPRPRYVG